MLADKRGTEKTGFIEFLLISKQIMGKTSGPEGWRKANYHLPTKLPRNGVGENKEYGPRNGLK